MPSMYTHYYFGKLVLEQLPEDIKNKIICHRHFYDAGQNGPDLLLYHAPLKGSFISKQNTIIHQQSGLAFFERTLLNHKNQESHLAYIQGYICHFVLDAYCHPYIENYREKHHLSHMLIEREFERYLLEKNHLNPFKYSLTSHILPSSSLEEVMASYVEGASIKDLRQTLKNMKRMYAFTKVSSSLKRLLIYVWMDIIKKPYLKDFVFTKNHLEICDESNQYLNKLLENAVSHAIKLIKDYQYGDLSDPLYLEIFG